MFSAHNVMLFTNGVVGKAFWAGLPHMREKLDTYGEEKAKEMGITRDMFTVIESVIVSGILHLTIEHSQHGLAK